MKRLFILLAAIFAFASANAEDYIRILAIGNSFSVDVVEQNLHELAKAQGKTLVIGNLYIGGSHYARYLPESRWLATAIVRKA